MTDKRVCQNLQGCPSPRTARGVVFITVRVDGAPTRLCGGCWEALRKVTS